jgi:hypothetical protein
MKRQAMMPPYNHEESRSTKMVLPVTMAIIGASVVVMAIMLLTKDKGKISENGSYDVENYDIVDNQPFIYSICE